MIRAATRQPDVETRIRTLDIVQTGAGLCILMIGAAVPDTRIAISNIGLSPILFILSLLFLSSRLLQTDSIYRLLILQIPLIPLGISILWSSDSAYGAYKFYNLLLSTNITGLFFLRVIQESGWKVLVRCILLLLVMLLATTIAYKWRTGLFDRNTPFFLLGPITFARLMGVAMILSLFSLSGILRIIAASIFLLATVWSASKGPILAAVFVFMIWIYFSSNSRMLRWAYTAGIAVLLLAVIILARAIDIDAFQLGRLSVLWTLSPEDIIRHGATNSVSVRYWLGVYSLKLISAHPFGVGLGGWASSVSNSFGLSYPHNLVLELWSEGGLIFGSIALMTFCMFLFSRQSVWKYLALFSFIAQLVSGDLLDARFLLLFSLLSVASYNRIKPYTIRPKITSETEKLHAR